MTHPFTPLLDPAHWAGEFNGHRVGLYRLGAPGGLQAALSASLEGATGEFADRQFTDFPSLLKPGDCLVFNDTRVIPARLFGQKDSGGQVEVMVERLLDSRRAKVEIRASKALKPGRRIEFGEGLALLVLGRDEAGFYEVARADGGALAELLEQIGHIPLPPYITRADEKVDAERYQTVYARQPGAVAAPTAGLHFDAAMLADLREAGIEQTFVTLHVGAGTYQPVKTDNLDEHRMHSEWYQVPLATQQALADCKARGGRVVAVGTTTVRSLESWAATGQAQGDTQIFITPGFAFAHVDMLLTNFHLPKSSLMMLVSAFAGYEPIRALYRHAIAQEYRFFSYGDAMLLARQSAQ